MNKELDAISRVMSQTYGWDISHYDETFVTKSIDKRLAATGIESATAYGTALSENSTEADAFFRSLNISYSEFFRNPLTFALLEQLVLPGLIAAKEKTRQGELRIWSAGCAAGQEAYSIAILLDELTTARGNPVPYRIFATDISNSELELARQGVYDYAAVQNVRLKHLRTYFTVKGETNTINSALKDHVNFSAYDLLDSNSASPPASIYGDFDLILCSNVMLYYRLDVRQRILDKVVYCLSPNGYLVTGEAERGIVKQTSDLRTVVAHAPIFQKNRH